MMKKSIALTTLVSFLAFSWSCYSWKKTPLLSVKPEERTELEISAVQVRSGEKVEFKDPAASIQGDSVVYSRFTKDFKLERSKIKGLWEPFGMQVGQFIEIRTTDGMLYKTERIKGQDDTSITFDTYLPVYIPLADVDFLWIKEPETIKNILLFAGCVAGFIAGLYAYVYYISP